MGGGARDVDVTSNPNTTAAIIVTAVSIAPAVTLIHIHPATAVHDTIAIVPPTVGTDSLITAVPDTTTDIATNHLHRVMETVTAINIHHLAAATVMPARVIITSAPAPPPSALTSLGVCPRRSAGVDPGGVVVVAHVPTSGGGDGRGRDGRAAAPTTFPIVTIAASVFHASTTQSPAPPSASSSRAIIIDINSSEDLVDVDVSSLLPLTVMVMAANFSSGERGGVSGFPLEVRRIAAHPLPSPTVTKGGFAWHVIGRPTALAKFHLADAPPRPGRQASLLPSST